MVNMGYGASLLVLGQALTAIADNVEIEPGQKSVMIEAVRTKTVAAELNEVADQGFRVRMSSADSDSGRMQISLERVTTPPNNFRYQHVATFSAKTKGKEINAAGFEVFRITQYTFISKKGTTIFNTEPVVLMEMEPNPPPIMSTS